MLWSIMSPSYLSLNLLRTELFVDCFERRYIF